MVKNIKAHELKALVERGAIVIDVREKEELDNKTIDGSQNWPLSNFNSALKNVSKSRPTIFYCTSGLRSLKAAEIAQECTEQDVYTLDGGIHEYSQSI